MNSMALLDTVKAFVMKKTGVFSLASERVFSKMKDQTFDSLHKLTEKDWPTESFRGFSYHEKCKGCGEPFMGPKSEDLCYLCKGIPAL